MYANQLGIGAHGCILPMDALYAFDQARQSILARQCLQAVAQENTGTNVIIHCFSNNGFTMYKHASSQLKDDQKNRLRYVYKFWFAYYLTYKNILSLEGIKSHF